MRLSEFVAMVVADLEANGDTEHVRLGVTMPGTDGNLHRVDADIAAPLDVEILRDHNYPTGMTVIAGDHKGAYKVSP